MSLPDGFIFSQSNLQDYADCQRRFQLRHMLHQAWPAVEAEPYLENERKIDQGARFHQIVRQHHSGVSEQKITRSISNDELMATWWDNYLRSINIGVLSTFYQPGCQRYTEIALSVPIGRFRLVAKYDVLVIQPDGDWTILDWKTSQNPPRRHWLEQRLQTHVYPYVLSSAGPRLVDQHALDPAQIEMVYWFTNLPEQPVNFAYSSSARREDERFLNNLVSTIDQKNEPVFPLTPDTKRCLFCTYRSLCNRGVQAGELQHLEEWLEPETPDEVTIDFDQIGEIEL
jgi:CRISPR/Cas system-associated exonuclease Cas4 (RecB family)